MIRAILKVACSSYSSAWNHWQIWRSLGPLVAKVIWRGSNTLERSLQANHYSQCSLKVLRLFGAQCGATVKNRKECILKPKEKSNVLIILTNNYLKALMAPSWHLIIKKPHWTAPVLPQWQLDRLPAKWLSGRHEFNLQPCRQRSSRDWWIVDLEPRLEVGGMSNCGSGLPNMLFCF